MTQTPPTGPQVPGGQPPVPPQQTPAPPAAATGATAALPRPGVRTAAGGLPATTGAAAVSAAAAVPGPAGVPRPAAALPGPAAALPGAAAAVPRPAGVSGPAGLSGPAALPGTAAVPSAGGGARRLPRPANPARAARVVVQDPADRDRCRRTAGPRRRRPADDVQPVDPDGRPGAAIARPGTDRDGHRPAHGAHRHDRSHDGADHGADNRTDHAVRGSGRPGQRCAVRARGRLGDPGAGGWCDLGRQRQGRRRDEGRPAEEEHQSGPALRLLQPADSGGGARGEVR